LKNQNYVGLLSGWIDVCKFAAGAPSANKFLIFQVLGVIESAIDE
jgi:hypothetical protein